MLYIIVFVNLYNIFLLKNLYLEMFTILEEFVAFLLILVKYFFGSLMYGIAFTLSIKLFQFLQLLFHNF